MGSGSNCGVYYVNFNKVYRRMLWSFIILINCRIFVSILTYMNIPFFEAFDQNGTKHMNGIMAQGRPRVLKVSKYSILTFPTIHAYGMKLHFNRKIRHIQLYMANTKECPGDKVLVKKI